jgi:hypothetical protein
MKAPPRTALGINLALLAAGSFLMAYRWIDSRPDAATPAAATGEAELRAPATVTSVSELSSSLDSSPASPSLRVCFTLDSLAAIGSGDRSFYETAERDRQAAHGPRCLVEPARQLPDSLNPGDRLEVIFTLEDGGRIEVEKLVPPAKPSENP